MYGACVTRSVAAGGGNINIKRRLKPPSVFPAQRNHGIEAVPLFVYTLSLHCLLASVERNTWRRKLRNFAIGNSFNQRLIF